MFPEIVVPLIAADEYAAVVGDNRRSAKRAVCVALPQLNRAALNQETGPLRLLSRVQNEGFPNRCLDKPAIPVRLPHGQGVVSVGVDCDSVRTQCADQRDGRHAAPIDVKCDVVSRQINRVRAVSRIQPVGGVGRVPIRGLQSQPSKVEWRANCQRGLRTDCRDGSVGDDDVVATRIGEL